MKFVLKGSNVISQAHFRMVNEVFGHGEKNTVANISRIYVMVGVMEHSYVIL